MADVIYSYLVFFYWLSGAAIAISVVLAIEVISLRRAVRAIDVKVDESLKDIHLIKRRLEKVKIGDMGKEDIEVIASKFQRKGGEVK